MSARAWQLPDCGSAQAYAAWLRTLDAASLLTDVPTVSPRLAADADRLLDNLLWGLFRRREVRDLVRCFCREIAGRELTLLYRCYLPEKAYMTDSGTVAFSLTLLHLSSAPRVLKVVLHELSHWWAACQEDYDRCLLLDEACLHSGLIPEAAPMLSPVELRVTVMGCQLLKALIPAVKPRHRPLLEQLLRTELNTLDTAIRSLDS